MRHLGLVVLLLAVSVQGSSLSPPLPFVEDDWDVCCAVSACADMAVCQGRSVPLLTKLMATNAPLQGTVGQTCPGGKLSCPDSYTCCELPDGGYGCCPTQKATCCADHLHCCPHGATCDLKDSKCKFPRAAAETESLRVDAQTATANTNTMCPGGDFQCPDRFTCCPLAAKNVETSVDVRYGCCPFENAVCCADHQHCCPRGFRCSSQTGACLPETQQLPSQFL